ncbi:hypothetical protein COU58_04730 [Candidatus Pacearchaeota archaeon CG10_big_fil_rev_8_21_14_0_10_32_42]|nr:MAG: hypothetical protein COU58_04730 [Candidatus Pacearchaeota archaeon CG10_big_fil_rev_8_21_14_0_10_32_42]
MGLKNKVIAGAVALAIGVGGYFGISSRNEYLRTEFAKRSQPIVGTVLEEGYQNTLTPNPEWNWLVSYSNETVKLESKYTLKIQTDDGRILGVSIVDGGNVKKESLDAIIDEGTRISFPAGDWKSPSWIGDNKVAREETYFTPDTKVGTKRADRITVLDSQ